MSDPWPDDWVGPWWVEQQRAGRPTDPSWTSVGSLAGPERLLVDTRGYLAPDGCPWGVDWWIGADDRWHLPSREAAVRQALVGDAPVVQTSLRVPSGDVHARVGAVAVGDGTTRVAVEVHNDSAAPVALALALRPSTPAGRGRIAEASLDGDVVRVDGAPAILLPDRPRAAWAGGRADGDPFAAISRGEAADPPAALRVTCPAGLAGVVVVVPLAHRSTYRWQLALSEAVAAATLTRSRPGRGRPARGRSLRRPGSPAAHASVAAPSLDAVARGWAAQVGRLVRLELPPTAALAPLAAVRSHLLLATGLRPVDPEVAVAAATAGLGVRDPGLVLEESPPDGRDRALWAAARLVGLGGTPPDPRMVKEAAERLGASSRGRSSRGASSRGASGRGSSGPGASGPGASSGLAAGMRAAARLLASSGEHDAAAAADRWADDLEGVGRPPHAMVASVSGDPAWHRHLAEATAAASPTVTWRDALGARGDDPLAPARWWSALRAFLVDDSRPGELAVITTWPPEFGRAPLEAHQLPTTVGLASFAVRWHDERPALLWDIDGAPSDLTVRAPGLDPAWRGRGARGEALLEGPSPLA